MKFKIGDKVKYISGRHGDGHNNPLWGGKNGKVEGLIEEIDEGIHGTGLIYVRWSHSKTRNSYFTRDLQLARKESEPHPYTNIFK